MNTLLEWSGAIVGLLGALLLALNGRLARFGWLCFLVANIALITWAARLGAHGLLAQQLGFSLTSLLGMKRSGLWPSGKWLKQK